MNVVLADTADIARIGMRTVLEDINLLPGQKLFVYEADDNDSLASAIDASSPDVVVVEAAMVEDSLNSSLVGMVKRYPETHWVIFAQRASRLVLLFTKEHPSFSIILRNSTREEIQVCLRMALKKQQYICNACMKQLLGLETDSSKDSILTPAECTVLALLAQGLQVKDIADLQCRSRHTIKTHKRDIFAKLGVKNTLAAVMTAYRLKIINPPE